MSPLRSLGMYVCVRVCVWEGGGARMPAVREIFHKFWNNKLLERSEFFSDSICSFINLYKY